MARTTLLDMRQTCAATSAGSSIVFRGPRRFTGKPVANSGYFHRIGGHRLRLPICLSRSRLRVTPRGKPSPAGQVAPRVRGQQVHLGEPGARAVNEPDVRARSPSMKTCPRTSGRPALRAEAPTHQDAPWGVNHQQTPRIPRIAAGSAGRGRRSTRPAPTMDPLSFPTATSMLGRVPANDGHSGPVRPAGGSSWPGGFGP